MLLGSNSYLLKSSKLSELKNIFENCLFIKFSATMKSALIPVYWLNDRIKLYLIFGPTVNAVLLGNVHGVVVQAKTKISKSLFKKLGRFFFFILNWAVTVVSVTSWYVPGWFNSWELIAVPALGE